jgi:hypothetical protein
MDVEDRQMIRSRFGLKVTGGVQGSWYIGFRCKYHQFIAYLIDNPISLTENRELYFSILRSCTGFKYLDGVTACLLKNLCTTASPE